MNELAGRHGFGRIDMIENRLIGVKSPRDLRGARRAHAHPGAQGARGPVPRARGAALQARRRAEVGRARLQRHVVLAAQGGARRLRRHHPEARHRRRAAALLQGQLRGRRPPQPVLALRLQPRDLRRGRHASTTRPRRASSTCGGFPPRCGHASAARSARKARSKPHARHRATRDRHHPARGAAALRAGGADVLARIRDGAQPCRELERRRRRCRGHRSAPPTTQKESGDE